MTKRKTNLILVLPALVFIANELIRTFIRPEYGKSKYGLLSEVLGWLPNFLAGFGMMALGTAVVIFVQMVQGKEFNLKIKRFVLAVISTISLLGLILHELTQKGTGLHYDLHDIYATIAGVIIGSILYVKLLFKPQLKTAVHP